MVLLSLIPQIQLWIARGRDWNGAYVSPQGDEPLYSAYINALIDGRPRKNDPFGGRDDSPAAPLPESTFSIQVVPAYTIAVSARLLRLTASTAFIILLGVSAFSASLSVFWLLDNVTANEYVSGAGALFVLCLGWVMGRHGIFNTFFDVGIPALHFLRRYQPALAFPLFFAFQLAVWKSFHAERAKQRMLLTSFAGVTLVALIFSYLYLWTGAAAWLVCFGGLWLYFRPSERRRTFGVLATVGAVTVLALVPYVYLVSLRSTTFNEQLTFLSTRRPDLLRMHELLGAVILILLAVAVRRGRIKWVQPQVLFAVSLAVLPFVVFNQQLLTGKVMQPFHFEIFVVNYSTLVGLIVTVAVLLKPTRRLVVLTAILSVLGGLIAVVVPMRIVFLPAAIANDGRIPVLLRLKELSTEDGTLNGLRTRGTASTLVFSPSLALSRLLPTWTSQGTLLDLGGIDFGSVTREERKKFFYQHLYYSKVEAEALRRTLNNQGTYPTMDSSARSLIFGHERVTRALSVDFKPIGADEIEREVQAYEQFIKSFARYEALKRPVAYAVIPDDSNFDFSNLDRWYERDAGEGVEGYTLYRLRLRSE